MNDIILAYPGVHQIFQLALAAHEIGRLERLICTAVDLPGKTGRLLSRMARMPSARPLGLDQLPPEKINEFPWPVLAHRLGARIFRQRQSEHLHSNAWFDRHVAGIVRKSHAAVFVGCETSALLSLRAARDRGMKCVLDCPGIPSWFLNEQAARAAGDLGLPAAPSSNSPEMLRRKKDELDLADLVLVCSDLQKRLLVERGMEAGRIRVNPLWVDAPWWAIRSKQTERTVDHKASRPLRVLYAGAVSLRKGVPYLIQAMQLTGDAASLTVVGFVSPELRTWLTEQPVKFESHSYVPKEDLRKMFHAHDILVMPSLGDSFGFVALEAMAAGLPVIVSSNCGVPVPDESWRVPAANAKAIADRLAVYLKDRNLLAAHGAIAATFAAQFTPERYRAGIRRIYDELLPAAR